MILSARNQLAGSIESVTIGKVMAEIVVNIGGGQQMVSEISAKSAKTLKLKTGMKVIVVVKSTEIMIGIPE